MNLNQAAVEAVGLWDAGFIRVPSSPAWASGKSTALFAGPQLYGDWVCFVRRSAGRLGGWRGLLLLLLGGQVLLDAVSLLPEPVYVAAQGQVNQ